MTRIFFAGALVGALVATLILGIVGGVPLPLFADSAPPSVPQLVSPAAGATLPNGSFSGNQQVVWQFNWQDSRDLQSGVKGYELVVRSKTAQNPYIDTFVTESQHRDVCTACYVTSLQGWVWKVRAQDNAGNWSAWSPEQMFNIAPPTQ